MFVRARNRIQWAHKSIAFAIYLPDLNKKEKETGFQKFAFDSNSDTYTLTHTFH